jgi:ABC-type glycerol-3-phosphate transport system permease component
VTKHVRSQFALLLILSVGATVILVPFAWMVLSSFKPNAELVQLPPTLLPEQPTFANYVRVWTEISFGRYMWNSLWLATVKTLLALYTSALAGYLFAVYDFAGKRVLFALVLATMMVPWPVTIIAQYQQMLWFGWVGTYTALIVPALMNSFGIFMMRQFIAGLPRDLIDAARVDGASEFGIFHRIILPLSRAAAAALAVFLFLWSWDDFLWPYLMLLNDSDYVLPIGVALLQGRYEVDYGAVFAGMSISILPVIIVYLFLQRSFVEGIAFSGLKG